MSSKCKKSNFGNCGPEAEGEYCLFHKPDKNKEESIKFYERIKKEADKEKIDIEGQEFVRLIFHNKLNWKGYEFPNLPEGFRSENLISPFFRKAIFEKPVDFSSSTFHGLPTFTQATFESKARFMDVSFEGPVDFRNTNFKKPVKFDGTKFKNGVDFFLADFNSEKERKFSSADFMKVEFRGQAEFGRVNFWAPVTFSNAKFKTQANFKEATFHASAFFEFNNFQKMVFFDKAEFQDSSEAANCYSIQKRLYEERGNKENADRMFVKEMQARRTKKSKLSRFLEWLIAEATCKYGTSWKRVLGVSALILFGYSIVYWSVSSLTGAAIVFQNGETISSLTLPNLWNSIHYSAVTFTTLGYGNMFPQGFLEFVSDLEAITGAILMALLVAVFARKWMR